MTPLNSKKKSLRFSEGTEELAKAKKTQQEMYGKILDSIHESQKTLAEAIKQLQSDDPLAENIFKNLSPENQNLLYGKSIEYILGTYVTIDDPIKKEILSKVLPDPTSGKIDPKEFKKGVESFCVQVESYLESDTPLESEQLKKIELLSLMKIEIQDREQAHEKQSQDYRDSAYKSLKYFAVALLGFSIALKLISISNVIGSVVNANMSTNESMWSNLLSGLTDPDNVFYTKTSALVTQDIDALGAMGVTPSEASNLNTKTLKSHVEKINKSLEPTLAMLSTFFLFSDNSKSSSNAINLVRDAALMISVGTTVLSMYHGLRSFSYSVGLTGNLKNQNEIVDILTDRITALTPVPDEPEADQKTQLDM